MLAEAGGLWWLLLFIYIIPVVVGYKAVKRLFKNINEKRSKDRGIEEPRREEPRRTEARKFYSLFFIIPILIFFIFVIFRIFAPEEIFAKNLQSEIFHNYWVYVMSAGIPLSFVGIGWGLRSMSQNSKSGWPVLCVLGSFATLFLISIFSVLLFI